MDRSVQRPHLRLAYRFDDSNKGNQEVPEPQDVLRVVRHNPELARLYVEECRQLGFSWPAGTDRRSSRTIAQAFMNHTPLVDGI
jgi:hypothetical protein